MSFAASTIESAPSGALPQQNYNIPRMPDAASAALAHLNYATYMYYLGVAALAQARLAQSATSYSSPTPPPPAPAPVQVPVSARGAHMRVHSTASSSSLRSASSIDTTATFFASPTNAGAGWYHNHVDDGRRTPDTCYCSDIASDDDGAGCPLNDLPTSCASTPIETPASPFFPREKSAHERVKIAALAASATLRHADVPPQPQILQPEELAAEYPRSTFLRMGTPLADGVWWACVTGEKPWAPVDLPPPMKMPADARRLPKINTRLRGGRRRSSGGQQKGSSWPASPNMK